jgi:hypothetical protein
MLMRPQEEQESEAEKSRQHRDADSNWPCQSMDVVTEERASQANQAGPYDSSKPH